MVAAAAAAVTHFSSKSTSFLSESQSIVCISRKAGTLYGLNKEHEWISLANLSKASRIELRAPPSFPPTKCLLNQCRCSGSANLLTENEIVTFFQGIGLDEYEAESLLEKNPTLRVASFDKIRSRILSLQSVGIKGIAFRTLISKHPNLLLAEEIDPFICFVRDDLEGNVEVKQLERLLSLTALKLLVGFDHKVRLLLQHGVPREKLVHVLNNTNLTKAFCIKSVEDIERTFAFLEPFGGSDLIARYPKILNYNLDSQLIPKIRVLNQLSGGDVVGTAAVLRKFPAILSYSAEHIGKHIEFLRSYAELSDQEIFRIFVVFPAVISASRERKLRPRIEFLKQCGLDSEDIFKFLTKAPLFLALSFDNLALKLGFLVKIGYEYRTRELAAAMGSVTRTSCENLQKVIELFSSYGLSFADIFSMSKKHPQILQYNHRAVEEKMDYLTVGMGREVGELLAFPAFLGYKLDDRIKHRYEVKRKTLGEGWSINTLLSLSAERFLTKIKENPIHIDNCIG